MTQVLKATACTASNRLTASWGYDLDTAVMQTAGNVTSSLGNNDNYGYYTIGCDSFKPPPAGDGLFRAYFSGTTKSRSTPCGNLSATAYPQVYLFIKGTQRAVLTASTTSLAWKDAVIASNYLQAVTSLADFQVRVYPRYGSHRCTDWGAEPTPKWYSIEVFGKIAYFELIIPGGERAGLEMGCVY